MLEKIKKRSGVLEKTAIAERKVDRGEKKREGKVRWSE